MNKEFLEHIHSADPVIYQLAKMFDLPEIEASDQLFVDLCNSIASQQLSTKAAATIFSRFKELFTNQIPNPAELSKLSGDQLRSVGLSWAKVRSVQDLAQHVLDGRLELTKLKDLPEELVKQELVAVKGIGPWTAEMILIFTLGRPDVFSPGDLGLKKSIQNLYSLLELPTPDQAAEIASKWSPYRSYASRLLWKSLDN